MMAYQPYYPGGWQPGPDGNTPISADALNHMEGQYDAVKEELQKTDGTSDMPITSPGGTEPNRLAVTNSNGRVGDSERLAGRPFSDFAVIASGTYTGNATDGRQINVGFKPRLVKVFRLGGTANVWVTEATQELTAAGFYIQYGGSGVQRASDSDQRVAVTQDGFVLGSGSLVNGNNIPFGYIAIG